MDKLQKQHAFDQIEMHLAEIKADYLESISGDEADSEVDDLNNQISDLEDDLADMQKRGDDALDRLDEIKESLQRILDGYNPSDDISGIITQVQKIVDSL